MEKRRHKRYKRRLTVDLDLGGQFLRAFIIDVSESGMFVQTNQSLAPGTVVAVRFAPTSTHPAMIVRAVVARRRTVPAHLRTIAASGLGLEVLEAPPEYQKIVLPPPEPGEAGKKSPVGTTANAAPKPKSTSPQASKPLQTARPTAPPVASEPPERRFKVFGSQVEGARSRSITVEAKNESVARERALAKFGAGWQILRIESVE